MRFVMSEVVRLHLNDGPNGEKNWIDVKKELTAGEDRAYRTAGMSGMRPESAAERKGKNEDESTVDIKVDFRRMAFSRAEMYIVEWSDKKPVTRSALEALCTEDFEEIDKAIEAHIERMVTEKNGRNRPPSPPQT